MGGLRFRRLGHRSAAIHLLVAGYGGTGFIESEVGGVEERSDLGIIVLRSFQLVMRDGLVSCYHSKDKSDATLYVLRSRLLNLFRRISHRPPAFKICWNHSLNSMYIYMRLSTCQMGKGTRHVHVESDMCQQ